MIISWPDSVVVDGGEGTMGLERKREDHITIADQFDYAAKHTRASIAGGLSFPQIDHFAVGFGLQMELLPQCATDSHSGPPSSRSVASCGIRAAQADILRRVSSRC